MASLVTSYVQFYSLEILPMNSSFQLYTKFWILFQNKLGYFLSEAHLCENKIRYVRQKWTSGRDRDLHSCDPGFKHRLGANLIYQSIFRVPWPWMYCVIVIPSAFSPESGSPYFKAKGWVRVIYTHNYSNPLYILLGVAMPSVPCVVSN